MYKFGDGMTFFFSSVKSKAWLQESSLSQWVTGREHIANPQEPQVLPVNIQTFGHRLQQCVITAQAASVLSADLEYIFRLLSEIKREELRLFFHAVVVSI